MIRITVKLQKTDMISYLQKYLSPFIWIFSVLSNSFIIFIRKVLHIFLLDLFLGDFAFCYYSKDYFKLFFLCHRNIGMQLILYNDFILIHLTKLLAILNICLQLLLGILCRKLQFISNLFIFHSIDIIEYLQNASSGLGNIQGS